MLGEIFRFLFLFLLVNRMTKIVGPTFSLFDTIIINFYKKSSFQIMAMVATAAIPLIARGYALAIEPGALTIYEYAEKLYIIPLNLVSFGLFTVLLSGWSQLYIEKGPHALDRSLGRALVSVGILAVLISCILFLTRSQIIDLIFGGTQFTRSQFSTLKDTFGIITLGLIPNLLSQVFSRGLLVRRNTRYIFYAATMVLTTVVASLLFIVPSDEVQGVALALVLGYYTSFISMCLLYLYDTRKRSKNAHIHRQHVQ